MFQKLNSVSQLSLSSQLSYFIMLIKNVYPLSEGDYTIGFDKKFVPFDSNENKLEDRPSGSLLVEIQPFLVETNESLILLDTGLGFEDEKNGGYIIHNLIKEKGYDIEDVDMVMLSHLHKDHAGGLILGGAPAFPEATHYIYRDEWEYAISQDGKSYQKDLFLTLDGQVNIQWLEEERGDITDDISYEHSGGHSREHIVFTIEAENRTLFFGGDEAPQSKQMKTRYIAKYDYDGKKALALREEYMRRGLDSDWTFLFYHDTKSPAVNFASMGG